jgi:hypothetical protein
MDSIMIPLARKDENIKERDTRSSNRRQYLKMTGLSAVGGMNLLSGCSGVNIPFGPSPEFEPEKVSDEMGTLPRHESSLNTSKKRSDPDDGVDDAIEISDSGLSAHKDSSRESESFSLSASVDPRSDLSRDRLHAAACSMAIRETYWQAPQSGRFEARAAYDVDGSWGYRFTCPDIVGEQIILYTAADLIILKNPESETDSDSNVHLSRSASTEGDKRGSIESLLEFVIRQIIRRRVGGIAGVIAAPFIDDIIEWGSALWDIATGDCHSQKSARDEFVSTTNTLRANFPAEEGQVYKIVFVPTVGWEYGANAINDASASSVSSEYTLTNISIK